ncbi:hypothetical protein M422DRAFT_242436 [Sphaerobolus stellatus SS14]|nr:hypothetical protein M422DRAFT_242436 [Sphaerobolus stellatus SS14]
MTRNPSQSESHDCTVYYHEHEHEPHANIIIGTPEESLVYLEELTPAEIDPDIGSLSANLPPESQIDLISDLSNSWDGNNLFSEHPPEIGSIGFFHGANWIDVAQLVDDPEYQRHTQNSTNATNTTNADSEPSKRSNSRNLSHEGFFTVRPAISVRRLTRMMNICQGQVRTISSLKLTTALRSEEAVDTDGSFVHTEVKVVLQGRTAPPKRPRIVDRSHWKLEDSILILLEPAEVVASNLNCAEENRKPDNKARREGFVVNLEEIFLVTGCDYGSNWANVIRIDEIRRDAEPRVEAVGFAGDGSAPMRGRIDVLRRRGPKRLLITDAEFQAITFNSGSYTDIDTHVPPHRINDGPYPHINILALIDTDTRPRHMYIMDMYNNVWKIERLLKELNGVRTQDIDTHVYSELVVYINPQTQVSLSSVSDDWDK